MIGLKKPLLTVAGAAFLLLGLIAYFVSAMEDRLRQHAVEARPENLESLRKIAKLELELFDLKGASANYLLTGDERWKKTIREHVCEVAPAIERVRTSVETPAEQAILDRISGIVAEARRVSQLALSAHDAGRHEEARRLVSEDLWDLTSQLRTACDESIEFNARLLAEAAVADLAAAASLRWATWGAVAGIGNRRGACRLAAVPADGEAGLRGRAERGRALDELVPRPRSAESARGAQHAGPLAPSGSPDRLRARRRPRDAGGDQRLDRTIASFLEFARTEKPQRRGNRGSRPHRPGRRGSEAVPLVRGTSASRSSAKRARLRRDGRQLAVVLQNLIVNGAQAMPRGGLVRARAQTFRPAGEPGAGSKDHRDRHRLRHSGTRAQAALRAIRERKVGRNRPGAHTFVHVSAIERRPARAGDERSRRDFLQGQRSGSATKDSKVDMKHTVLIVDDESTVLSSLKKILEDGGPRGPHGFQRHRGPRGPRPREVRT